MNNFKILSILIVFLGLIAIPAFAIDNINSLDASDFFYDDSPVNTSAVISEKGPGILKEAATPSIRLSDADFFYSQPIRVRVLIISGEDLRQRTEVASPSNHLNTPEIFYGYTDVIEVKEAPCANC